MRRRHEDTNDGAPRRGVRVGSLNHPGIRIEIGSEVHLPLRFSVSDVTTAVDVTADASISEAYSLVLPHQFTMGALCGRAGS